MQDIIVRRFDGLYFGYHVNVLEPMAFELIYPGLSIAHIKDGSGIWKIGAEYARVGAGDFVFLNNLEYRRMISGKMTAECYWFTSPVFSFIGSEECSRVFYGKGKKHTHILRGVLLDDIFSRIRSELHGARSFTLLSALTIEFICAAERAYANIPGSLDEKKPGGLSTAELITRSISYINDHYSEELNIPLLASFVGMSRSHYSRSFTKYVTIPPSEYIVRCRIGQFLSRMKDSAGILELAFECGFSSESGFYKAFHKVCGCAPGEYIKNPAHSVV